MLVVGLGIAVIVVIAWRTSVFYDETAPRSEVSEATTTPTAPAEDDFTNVLFIGDSYTGGSDMNVGPEWPELVGRQASDWLVQKDGVGGSGFIAAGQSRPIPTRLDGTLAMYRGLDLVVVAAGINDVGLRPTRVIARAVEDVLERIQAETDAKVVLVSPFAPTGPSQGTLDLAAAEKSIAEDMGVEFIDVSQLFVGNTNMIGSDGIHPTDEGHAYIAEQVGPDVVASVS